MKKKETKQYMDGVLVLLLFAIFATCILSVLMAGAGVYKRIVARDTAQYNARTCARYLETKIRSAECAEQVAVLSFGDGDALSLKEEIGGREYATLIYLHDGWLMELFSAADSGMPPESGEKLMEAETLELTRSGDLLQIDLTDGEGTQQRLFLSLRGGEGAAA